MRKLRFLLILNVFLVQSLHAVILEQFNEQNYVATFNNGTKLKLPTYLNIDLKDQPEALEITQKDNALMEYHYAEEQNYYQIYTNITYFELPDSINIYPKNNTLVITPKDTNEKQNEIEIQQEIKKFERKKRKKYSSQKNNINTDQAQEKTEIQYKTDEFERKRRKIYSSKSNKNIIVNNNEINNIEKNDSYLSNTFSLFNNSKNIIVPTNTNNSVNSAQMSYHFSNRAHFTLPADLHIETSNSSEKLIVRQENDSKFKHGIVINDNERYYKIGMSDGSFFKLPENVLPILTNKSSILIIQPAIKKPPYIPQYTHNVSYIDYFRDN